MCKNMDNGWWTHEASLPAIIQLKIFHNSLLFRTGFTWWTNYFAISWYKESSSAPKKGIECTKVIIFVWLSFFRLINGVRWIVLIKKSLTGHMTHCNRCHGYWHFVVMLTDLHFYHTTINTYLSTNCCLIRLLLILVITTGLKYDTVDMALPVIV